MQSDDTNKSDHNGSGVTDAESHPPIIRSADPRAPRPGGGGSHAVLIPAPPPIDVLTALTNVDSLLDAHASHPSNEDRMPVVHAPESWRPTASAPHENARAKRLPVAPTLLSVDQLETDEAFRIRPDGDISLLATDLARLGQLFPIDVRKSGTGRFEVVSGHRRVAALKFLQREKVLARIHEQLSDEDALLMALASAIHAQPVTSDELRHTKLRLETEGRLTPATRDMLDKAVEGIVALSPENVDGTSSSDGQNDEQEVEADELALNVIGRLGELNQDLALLAEVYDALDVQRKNELLEQLRYAGELCNYLETKA